MLKLPDVEVDVVEAIVSITQTSKILICVWQGMTID